MTGPKVNPREVPLQRRRTPRYPFLGGIAQLTDASGQRIMAGTEQLSRFGCFLRTMTPHIVAFQASTAEGRSQIHLVVDNPGAAKMALAAERLIYTEGEVVQVALRNLPGELARVTSRLAEVNVNINYAYGGSDLLFFGVAEVGRAAKILDLKPPLPPVARSEN